MNNLDWSQKIHNKESTMLESLPFVSEISEFAVMIKEAYVVKMTFAKTWILAQPGLGWFARSYFPMVLSAAAYFFSIKFLLEIARDDHAGKVRAITNGEKYVVQYPDSFFVYLIIHLIPLTVAGFARHDEFLLATRFSMIAGAVLAYALVRSRDGTFADRWYTIRIDGWLAFAIFMPLLWYNSIETHSFVKTWEKIITYSIIGTTIIFIVLAQGPLAIRLFAHYTTGKYGFKSFRIQLSRYFGFFFQALMYLVAFDPLDDVFMAVLSASLGTLFVIILSLLGMLVGRVLRWLKERNSVGFAN